VSGDACQPAGLGRILGLSRNGLHQKEARMEDTSHPLELVAILVRWAAALIVALIVFLIYRWIVGPEMGWLGLVFGCVLFAGVALAISRIPWRQRG
jgi:hypothetical protein